MKQEVHSKNVESIQPDFEQKEQSGFMSNKVTVLLFHTQAKFLHWHQFKALVVAIATKGSELAMLPMLS
jgi:hypothetical protein